MNNFNNELNSRAKDLENVLEEILKIDNAPDKLIESLRYAVLAGGKRLRSFLLIEVADFYKVNRKNSLMVAAAIELIHAYSLIHDDLPALDDDDLRRNKPSTHIKFDEATAKTGIYGATAKERAIEGLDVGFGVGKTAERFNDA